jgi:chaperone BCS1
MITTKKDEIRSSFIPPSLSSNASLISTVTPIPVLLENYVKIDSCTYVEVTNHQLSGYIQRYIANTNNLSSYMINTSRNFFDESDSDDDETIPKGSRTLLKLGLGLHQIEFESHIIKILFSLVGSVVGTGNGAEIKDLVVLIIEEPGKQHILQQFCDVVINTFEKTSHDIINVYQYHLEYRYWRATSNKTPRSMDSIIIPQDVKTGLIKDIDEFLSKDTFNWYKSHGIPYKRSYLLYGPPGSGKSSIIQAIAGKYKRNICFIQPMKEKFTDEIFSTCIQVAPKRALIVLEDIDAYFNKNRESMHKSCPLTFSGLLNGLDGVGNTDGQIFILTTNFIDRLDEALVRSGRVDRKIEFPMVNLDSAFNMFLKFYPKEIGWASVFRDNLEKKLIEIDRKMCMADLQQHFIAHRKNSPQQASEDFDDITGSEYNRLAALAEKISKGDADKKEEENNSNNNQQNNPTTSESDTSLSVTPLSVAGSVVSFTVSSGLSLLLMILGMKYYNQKV